MLSGNMTSFFSTLANVAFCSVPWNGVVANCWVRHAGRTFRTSYSQSSRRQGSLGSTSLQQKYGRCL